MIPAQSTPGSKQEAITIDRLLPCVRASMRRQVPSMEAQRAEEMEAALRVRLVHFVRTWDPSKGHSLRTYCIMRLRYEVVEFMQIERRRRPERYGVTVESYDSWHTGDEELDWTELIPDSTPGPAEEALAEEDRSDLVERVLLGCLKLSAADRYLLYLLYWRGLSSEEAAGELGIHPTTLSYRKRRILTELRDRLCRGRP